MTRQQPRRPKHAPQRTCVICRRQFDKRRLTRIVRTADSGVVVDSTGKRNGRGAYLCDQPACWDRATQNAGLLNQALNAQITPEELENIAAFRPVEAPAPAA